MGYSIVQLETHFCIPADRQSGALSAIKSLQGRETNKGGGTPHFSWIDPEVFAGAMDLADVLSAWRWTPEFDESGDIVSIEFTGDKIGDEDILFGAIAPFVAAQSYIQVACDDGAVWRWLFIDGTVHKQRARLVYD